MLVIKFSQGLYKAQTSSREELAPTLEKLLDKLDPGAPPEKIAATAEILRNLIGNEQGSIRQGVISA